jgi:DNA primase
LVLDRADLSSPAERDRALAEVAPVLAGMGESATRDELLRSVAERLDMDPAMVIGRMATARTRAESRADAHSGSGTGAEAVLTPRERRERALLAMCIAEPKAGREVLERLTAEHLSSPLVGRALEWVRGHLDEPLAGLPDEDEELVSLVTQLVMTAEREPASGEAMEMNFLQLEQRRLEDEIADANEKGDHQRSAELHRQKAAVGERIERPERLAS